MNFFCAALNAFISVISVYSEITVICSCCQQARKQLSFRPPAPGINSYRGMEFKLMIQGLTNVSRTLVTLLALCSLCSAAERSVHWSDLSGAIAGRRVILRL